MFRSSTFVMFFFFRCLFSILQYDITMVAIYLELRVIYNCATTKVYMLNFKVIAESIVTKYKKKNKDKKMCYLKPVLKHIQLN